MKVYLEPQTDSRGIMRVRDALIRYAPKEIELSSLGECDLAILHVFGRNTSTHETVQWLRTHEKQYAVIQYVLRSSMRPNTKDWIDIWNDAKLVWSYYDLVALCKEDELGYFHEDSWEMEAFPFYYAPLGVDGSVFFDRLLGHDTFKILASAQHALSESVRECSFAVKKINKKMIHLGHELRRGKDIFCIKGISDVRLAEYYSQCEFVSGLRRIEGFEFPVIEGAMCGARPIVFDRPEMRHWFKEFSIFIPEGKREQVIESLVDTFRYGAMPVTEDEKKLIAARFNWETIIKGFWERIL